MVETQLIPCLQGGGECGALLRALDWSTNPLGDPNVWSSELHTVVGIAMVSRQPVLVVWGPEQICVYNDGYAAMCGHRHPGGLGSPLKDLWFDIWDTVEPIITAAYAGVSTAMDDIQFTMHRKGYPEETHFAFSYNPVRDRDGKVLGMICPCTETTSAVAQRSHESIQRSGLLQVVEIALGSVALLSGPDHRFEYANADYRKLIGNRDVVGLTVAEVLPEVVDQGFIDLLNTVYRTGEPFVGHGIPIEFQQTSDSDFDRRILDFLYHPMLDTDGTINGIFVHALDVTDQVTEEEQQELVNRELGHRMKNQLAMVQAIVNQTLRSASDLKSGGKVLNDRIGVLAKAHDMLITGGAVRTTVEAIAKAALSLHDDPKSSHFRICGPKVEIASRPALSLSLILHELSTNAAKYGALSTDGGSVEIVWAVVDDAGTPIFRLTWTERDGPPVTEPQKTGAGTRLIRAGLGGTVGCRVDLEYLSGGLRCEITAELKSFQTES